MCPLWFAWSTLGGARNLPFPVSKVLRHHFKIFVSQFPQRPGSRSPHGGLPLAQLGDDDVLQRFRVRDAQWVVPRHQQRSPASDLEGERVLPLHVRV